ncbi:MAG: molybdopterin-binding protein [bacterium]
MASGCLGAFGDVALLGALGRTRVDVYRAPVVAILSSGDELVEPDGPPPARGQVTNSNGIALAAAVRALGAEPRLLPVVRDDADAVRARRCSPPAAPTPSSPSA